MLGEEGLKAELELKGITPLGGVHDSGKHGLELPQDLGQVCEANPVGAVVCGFDRAINYYKLGMASVSAPCLLKYIQQILTLMMHRFISLTPTSCGSPAI